MKSLFSNKSKKNIGAFLVFIFLFNLFFNAVYVKKAEAAIATEATQIINSTLLGIIAAATSAIQSVTVPVIAPSTAATAVALSSRPAETKTTWPPFVIKNLSQPKMAKPAGSPNATAKTPPIWK